MSVVPLGNATPVQVVASQFADLDIPTAPRQSGEKEAIEITPR